jgi:hypothetical protein
MASRRAKPRGKALNETLMSKVVASGKHKNSKTKRTTKNALDKEIQKELKDQS